MKIFHGLEELAGNVRKPVVATIGNFDGVHRGHQWVIAEVRARAAALAASSLAITFDPHPSRVLRPEAATKLITPLRRKLELLAETGIDGALVLPFAPELYRMSAREFASRVLVEACGAVEVHEGENFRFGFGAEAGVDGLEALGRELGFGVRGVCSAHPAGGGCVFEPGAGADCRGSDEPGAGSAGEGVRGGIDAGFGARVWDALYRADDQPGGL